MPNVKELTLPEASLKTIPLSLAGRSTARSSRSSLVFQNNRLVLKITALSNHWPKHGTWAQCRGGL